MNTFVAIDFETGDAKRDSACAVGVARVEGGRVVYRDAVLIRPPRPITEQTRAVHGITNTRVRNAGTFAEVWPKLLPALDGATRLVAHNAPFDRGVLEACCKAAGIAPPRLPWVCTLEMARKLWPKPLGNKLPEVCTRLGVELVAHHEAGADAEACARVLIALEALEERHAGRGDGGGHRPGAAELRVPVPGGPGGVAGDRGVGRVGVLRDPRGPEVLGVAAGSRPGDPGLRRGPGMAPFAFEMPDPACPI